MLFSEFKANKFDFALVGGLALYFLGTSRTTFDADFMILLAQADAVDHVMKKLGYKCLQKTENVANYVSSNSSHGQVDFLFAHRKYALEMLQRADTKEIMGLEVKVLQPEDLIGLKVQSSSNDERRITQDMADIEALMERQSRVMDWTRIRDYFAIFGRQSEFERLRKRWRKS